MDWVTALVAGSIGGLVTKGISWIISSHRWLAGHLLPAKIDAFKKLHIALVQIQCLLGEAIGRPSHHGVIDQEYRSDFEQRYKICERNLNEAAGIIELYADAEAVLEIRKLQTAAKSVARGIQDGLQGNPPDLSRLKDFYEHYNLIGQWLKRWLNI